MARLRRLVLIDGTWLVFRCFFAIPPTFATTAGQPTNAIFGVARTFEKLFAGKRPELGAVCFDAPGERARDRIYPDYKANRGPVPGGLLAQWPWIDKLVAAIGFPVIKRPGVEADDLIATLTARGLASDCEVIVVAGDKDLAQLVGERVRMFDPVKDVTYDAALVEKHWGVPPERIPDLLALLGDSVDNIPGVEGIGAKGAQGLIRDHGSVEGIYAALDGLPKKQREKLEAGRERAFLSKTLALVDRDVALDVDLETLVIPEPDASIRDALYKELEFYSLLSAGQSDPPADEVPVISSAEQLEALIGAGRVAVQPIWDRRAPGDDVLTGIGLAGASAGYVPLIGDVDPALVAALVAFLADPARPKAVHDLKLMLRICTARGLVLDGVEIDTMLASFLVDPAKHMPHRLDQVAREYAQKVLPQAKSVTGAGQEARAFADLAPEAVAPYAGTLAAAIREVATTLSPRLSATDQRVHDAVEKPLAAVLARMEVAGVLVDRDDLGRMGAEFEARKLELERQIYALAGHEFNIGSTQQLGNVLFVELGLPIVKKTKTGWSTDAEVLERLAPKHEIARLVLDQRTLAKLINTYTDVLQASVSPRDGRIHASFQQTVGVSGRIIATDPDLQRTPVRTPEGRRIRKAFIAPPGHVLMSADWSQIELRVMAAQSRDPRLIAAFRDGTDVHRATAAELFGVAPDEVTAEQRNTGKTINFATIYGQGATALGQILGIPRKQAADYIERFFELYAGVRAWKDATVEQATKDGFVTTLLGRRRIIPELSSHLPMDQSAGQRIAVNTPIQGSAADLCKLAMLGIDAQIRTEGLSARMLMQIHDELVLEVPTAEVDAVQRLVREHMERPKLPTGETADLAGVPLVVNVGVGPTWAEAH